MPNKPKVTKVTKHSNQWIDWIENSISKKYIEYYENEYFHGDVKEIGSGRFGKVYRVNWEDSHLAVKSFVNFNIATAKVVVNELKLHHEVYFHENVIRFCGITSYQDQNNTKKYLLVMEYADGGTLRNYLKEHFNNLTWGDKFKLALQLTCAVSCLHNEKIVHLDLHSKNVLVYQNTIKLADYGLSRRIFEASDSQKKSFGMIPYADPRSFNNEKSDVYSVGVLLWEISSGHPPFSNKGNNISLAMNILEGLREKPIPNTPEDYIKIYTDCWSNEPDKRPTIKELVDKLKAIITNYDVIIEDFHLCNCSNEEQSTSKNVVLVQYKKSVVTRPLPKKISAQYIIQKIESTSNTIEVSENKQQIPNEKQSISNSMEVSKNVAPVQYKKRVVTRPIPKKINPQYIIRKIDSNSNQLPNEQQSTLNTVEVSENKQQILNEKQSTSNSVEVSKNVVLVQYKKSVVTRPLPKKISPQYIIQKLPVSEDNQQSAKASENIDNNSQQTPNEKQSQQSASNKQQPISESSTPKIIKKPTISKIALIKKIFDIIIKSQEEKLEKYTILNLINDYDVTTKDVYNWLSLNYQRNQKIPKFLIIFGEFNHFGIGNGVNKRKAFELFQKAADLGDAFGIVMLGYCYRSGIGTKFDKKKAFELYQKAANLGHASGIINLGYCYEYGIGTDVDKKKAFGLYQKTANLGNESGIYNLACCYQHGIGTSMNKKKAFELYQKVADLGNSFGLNNLGYCYQYKIGISINDIKKQMEKILNEKKASTKTNENKIGTDVNEDKIGTGANENKIGTDVNENKIGANVDEQKAKVGTSINTKKANEQIAFELYQKAANLGNRYGINNLGSCYQNGVGIKANKKTAFELYLKAANIGYIVAQSNLAFMYKSGEGTEKDMDKAIYWYNKSKGKKVDESIRNGFKL